MKSPLAHVHPDVMKKKIRSEVADDEPENLVSCAFVKKSSWPLAKCTEANSHMMDPMDPKPTLGLGACSLER